ncbi:hypothetical protein CRM22_000827 [Opisthorchis felineus]|uniref:Caspase family p20 domain-containing protein n=1 Tax=Opisthorchis felineus TaxID=147828 RepID=A0A4S2MJI4_OPIFE|nr:hypothetical protein CRM22_000827 [Opisthorchis felineus]
MDNEHRGLLRTMRVYLLNNVTRLEEILDHLESVRIISEEQRQRILSSVVPKDRLRIFLDTLPRCGPLAFGNFRSALQETNQESVIQAMDLELNKLEESQVVMNVDQPTTRTVRSFKPYSVSSNPCGYILIVNIENYSQTSGVSTRTGSSKDVERLVVLFQTFSYSVAVLQDPTAVQLEKAVREFSQKPEHKDVHAGGLFILAHGMEHHLIASDGSLVSIDDMVSNFTNPKCPGLAGKPKLLVIQACRGEQRDRGVLVRTQQSQSIGFVPPEHSLDPSSWLSLPHMSDCVIVYSTLPGFVSWRSETGGSWYISTFVDVFRLHGLSCSVMDMLAEVNNRLLAEASTMNIHQISQPVSTLTKPFYLTTKTDHSIA